MDILRLLDQGEYVSGTQIAASLRVSRAAVHKNISVLRTKGYVIAAVRNRGYMLVSSPGLLLKSEIVKHLPAAISSQLRIIHLMTTDSTQLRAKELASSGTPDWTVVVAEKQTAGYGRFRREWVSAEGGIWFSLVVRPQIPPENAAQTALLMGLAIVRAIEKSGMQCSLKWPNDVLCGGKKLAGVITEMSAEVGMVNWLVIGIGINSNNKLPASLTDTACSMKSVSGKETDRSALLASVIKEFYEIYSQYVKGGFRPFAVEYSQKLSIKGKSVDVTSAGGVRTGIVSGIDGDGALAIVTPRGQVEKILAGDVTLRR